jgi:hypothetical protein
MTEVWSDGKCIGRFTDEELELWFIFWWDESKDYQMWRHET